MVLIYRIVLTVGGLLLLLMGSRFLIDPAGVGVEFGLQVEGAHGLTSLRADFTSYFLVAGTCLILGVWAQRRDPLLIGAALLLVTLTGRLIGLAIDGSFEGYIMPMVAEAIFGLTAIAAARSFSQTERA